MAWEPTENTRGFAVEQIGQSRSIGKFGTFVGGVATEKAGGANMSVDVTPGAYLVNGILGVTTLTPTNLIIGASNATLDRIDLLIYDQSSGGLAIVVGANAADTAEVADPPALTADQVLVAIIDVKQAVTQINNGDIKDCRVFIPFVGRSSVDPLDENTALDTLAFHDDFLGDSVKSGFYTEGGTVAILDNRQGGILEVAGRTAGTSFLSSNKDQIEVVGATGDLMIYGRFQIITLGSVVECFIGLGDDDAIPPNKGVGVLFDDNGGTREIQLYSRGTATKTFVLETPATTGYHTFVLLIRSGEIGGYFDGSTAFAGQTYTGAQQSSNLLHHLLIGVATDSIPNQEIEVDYVGFLASVDRET